MTENAADPYSLPLNLGKVYIRSLGTKGKKTPIIFLPTLLPRSVLDNIYLTSHRVKRPSSLQTSFFMKNSTFDTRVEEEATLSVEEVTVAASSVELGRRRVDA